MLPDYTDTDFSPPEAFIPSTLSIPNKFDKTFLQKQQDLINGVGVTVNTSNAKVQTHPKLVKDRADVVLASNAGLEAAFDTQEAVVWGDLAEVKALSLLFQVGVVIASGQHSSGPTDAQGVTTALPTDSPTTPSIPTGGGRWLNSVIAHIPRAALANPAVTIAMADAHGTN